ncbi:arylsulfatase [Candidatus Sumerlaeota bacterium]|nr:arylsulfatase [Candidatus Sumerlaeota bacterium]
MLTLGAGLLKFSGCSTAPVSHSSSDSPPNIILMLADDMGYGDLGCYGQKIIQTPNIDRMARNGIRFTQFYAGSTVCAPSRSCLLTGLHTGHANTRGNGKVSILPDPGEKIIARYLKDAGYITAMIGKSSVSCVNLDDDFPRKKGFDYSFGFLSHWEAHDYFPPELYRNGEKIVYPNNTRHEGDAYSQQLFMDDAMRFLENNRDKRFFLHLSFQIPHASLYAPEEWKAKYRGMWEEVPETTQKHYRNEPEPRATYAAMVSRLDADVGAVLDKLVELGIADNTLVLFSSDNGTMREGGYDYEWFDSNGPLKGGKRDMYEGGIRTPLVAMWPRKIKPGTTTDHISAFWDFLPTACDAAGTPAPEGIDGISFLPTLIGSGDQKKHDYLYWEFHQGGKSGRVKQAVREGDWKAVRLNAETSPDAPVELYNLKEDIGETNDLATAQPEIAERLSQLMRKAHQPGKAFKMPYETAEGESVQGK